MLILNALKRDIYEDHFFEEKTSDHKWSSMKVYSECWFLFINNRNHK